MGARAALRQLRPPGGRRADSARRARPAAHRRRDHAVGHLPRPAAAADPAARRSGASSPPRADEPIDRNFVRKHALAYAGEHGCDLETAALRVFGNADGAYGSNVNHLIENSRWDDEDELAETYTRRKGFAYGRDGQPVAAGGAAEERAGAASSSPTRTSTRSSSASPRSTTTSTRWAASAARCAASARATAPPVYIGDQTRGDGVVRTLAEQVALETRTRMLNPKWYEGMLEHGYEGVRQIEAHVTQHRWAGRRRPARSRRGSTSSSRRPSCSTPRCASAWRRSIPTASAKVANRLLEAHERNYWTPDAAMLEALRRAGEELEDRLEGVVDGRLAA